MPFPSNFIEEAFVDPDEEERPLPYGLQVDEDDIKWMDQSTNKYSTYGDPDWEGEHHLDVHPDWYDEGMLNAPEFWNSTQMLGSGIGRPKLQHDWSTPQNRPRDTNMAYRPNIDEFIREEMERQMMQEREGPPPHRQAPQRTPNAYDVDPAEPGEGDIESLIRRFGNPSPDALESFRRRFVPGGQQEPEMEPFPEEEDEEYYRDSGR